MLHIAICDDEKDFVTYLTDLLNQYAIETGGEIKVSAFYDGMELIESYDTTIDLIFLDIQMKLINGLRTAERIRQIDEKVGIIFLTTLTQCALEGYKYQAANYIIKPIRYGPYIEHCVGKQKRLACMAALMGVEPRSNKTP